MREHLAEYYPLFLKHDVPIQRQEVCLKVVCEEGMIGWASWEVPIRDGTDTSRTGCERCTTEMGHEYRICGFARWRGAEDAGWCVEGTEGFW